MWGKQIEINANIASNSPSTLRFTKAQRAAVPLCTTRWKPSLVFKEIPNERSSAKLDLSLSQVLKSLDAQLRVVTVATDAAGCFFFFRRPLHVAEVGVLASRLLTTVILALDLARLGVIDRLGIVPETGQI
ncbi:hypothetical protein MHYP_G00310940 [Metynnis hypsauchen]